MNYDFNLIKITRGKDGNTIIDQRPFLKTYEDLDRLQIPDAFDKELERLSKVAYSDDLADKIRDVVKRAYARAKQGPDVTHFAVHSTVRSRHNRIERAQHPQHARFKQYILPEQRRLVRGRPTLITEQELTDHHGSLLEQHEAGILEVRTLDGRLVNLKAMVKNQPSVEILIEPAMRAPLAPHPVMDSVANDRPTGITFPRIPGGKILSQNEVAQVVSGMASVEGELQVDPKTGAVTVAQDGVQEPEVEIEEDEVPHDLADAAEAKLVPEDDEEEIEELPPGIPPPPPPPGGQPRLKNKKNRR